ncbi:hypothetical protein HY3_05770 [Hyphomonas pacifica]|uniref:Uncharacterized protein n=1 Tax=Hyphomonas pacifica TaxID=1280941 RepID=A0A8B2PJA9_9PROT|nr:hypothetical protein HY3_05770 [Hyphomonas pacifica]
MLGVSGVSVGRYCRDREDPEHRQPRRTVAEKLAVLTHGVIHVGNYADDITEDEAAEMMAEIERRSCEAAS